MPLGQFYSFQLTQIMQINLGVLKIWPHFFVPPYTCIFDKKLSCRREAARCFVFLCSQLQHTYSAVFLLLVTVASDLLMHKILLNSVSLSPIVSGGVRPKLPGQTSLGHNPLVFCRSWVGWGQDPASWVG